MRSPTWFDRRGVEAWVSGMASILGRRVTVRDLTGVELTAAGIGDGEPLRLPVAANGTPVATIEIVPAPSERGGADRIRAAAEVFQALAEVRNSMADLVETTAHQWRELNLLYRSTELLQGGLEADSVARHLLDQAAKALRGSVAAVRYRCGGEARFAATEPGLAALADVTARGEQLAEGVLVLEDRERERLGFDTGPGSPPFLVVPVRSGDSVFGALAVVSGGGRMLGAEHLKLARLLADQAGQAFAILDLVTQVRDSERLRRELEVAAEIQASILPPARLAMPGIELAGTCRPATWVGGDVYLVLPAGEDGTLLAVADVSGHGVSSALLMNAFASQLTALAATVPDPGRLLEITNDLVAARVGTMGMFVTAVVLRFGADGRCRVANAGHPPPIVVAPGRAPRLLETAGLPLGILEGERYAETAVTIEPEEVLLAYSDGLTEAAAAGGEMLGVDGLAEIVGRRVGQGVRGTGLVEAVLDELAGFTGGAPPTDDLTVVTVRRTA